MFAVSKYLNHIRVIPKRDADVPHYEYFAHEHEARHFILVRAQQEVARAEKVLQRAKKRHAKCVKKFGAKLEEGT